MYGYNNNENDLDLICETPIEYLDNDLLSQPSFPLKNPSLGLQMRQSQYSKSSFRTNQRSQQFDMTNNQEHQRHRSVNKIQDNNQYLNKHSQSIQNTQVIPQIADIQRQSHQSHFNQQSSSVNSSLSRLKRLSIRQPVDMSSVTIIKRKGLSPNDYAFFKEKKNSIMQQQRKVNRFTLREAVEQIIVRKQKIRHLQKFGVDLDHLQHQSEEEKQQNQFMVKAQEILQTFKDRDTRGNIVVLKKELKDLQKSAGIINKKGFSFSQAIKEINIIQEHQKHQQIINKERIMTDEEQQVSRLNQFLERYQDKFCIQSFQSSPQQNPSNQIIDFEQFFLSSKNQNRLEAFKESFKNLKECHSIHGTMKERSQKDGDKEQEQEAKVMQMYNQIINKNKFDSVDKGAKYYKITKITNTASGNLRRELQRDSSHFKLSKLCMEDEPFKQLQNFNKPISKKSNQLIAQQQISIDKSLQSIRKNCKSVMKDYHYIGESLDFFEKDYNDKLTSANDKIRYNNRKSFVVGGGQ